MKWILRIGGGLIGILLLAVVVLLVLGRRAEAGQLNGSIEIAAPPAQVWPWLNDPEKLKQWVSWLVEVQGPADPARGSQQVWVMRDENNGGAQMRISSTCTEAAPPHRLALNLSADGGFTSEQSYELTQVADGRTRLDVHSRFRFALWFARLMEPLITPSARKKMVADMASLKSRVESGK